MTSVCLEESEHYILLDAGKLDWSMCRTESSMCEENRDMDVSIYRGV